MFVVTRTIVVRSFLCWCFHVRMREFIKISVVTVTVKLKVHPVTPFRTLLLPFIRL